LEIVEKLQIFVAGYNPGKPILHFLVYFLEISCSTKGRWLVLDSLFGNFRFNRFSVLDKIVNFF
jgi:hypothetical protein